MRPAMWVALDLIADAIKRRSFLWLNLPFLAWWPLQMGFIDGGASTSPLWAAGFGFRHSLLMGASWPALTGLGLFVEILLPRKLTGRMEPLIAAPIPTNALLAAFVAPQMILATLYPILACPLTMLGYRLGAGQWPPDAATLALRLFLGAQVASVWLAVSGVGALLAARSPAAFMIRSLWGYLPLLAVDVAQTALIWSASPGLVAPLLGVACAAGWVTLRLVFGAARRDALLGGA